VSPASTPRVRFPRSVPTTVFLGVLIFVGLLFGGYFVGSTRAISTQPVYITDPSGTSGANVNSQGHLSVHIADALLPGYRGPAGPRRAAFPVMSLKPGQCYSAFIRGPGAFLSASFSDQPGTGSGRPRVLVRVDRSVVWLEDGSFGSTPVATVNGVQRVGNTLAFGFPYTLYFNLFSGVVACWDGPGQSDKFAIQMTVSGEGGFDVVPTALLFTAHPSSSGGTYSWQLTTQGDPETGFQLFGTKTTEVTYYSPLSNILPTTTRGAVYTVHLTKPAPPRLYVFELFSGGNPNRIGPFGSWSGL